MDYSKDEYYKMQQRLANQAYGAADYGQKMPFYMTYPIQNLYMTELEYEKEMERMKDLYPSEVKRLQEYVEEECDKLEYDGSLMFDEYPDRLMLRRICDRIYQKAMGGNIEAQEARKQNPPKPEPRPFPPGPPLPPGPGPRPLPPEPGPRPPFPPGPGPRPPFPPGPGPRPPFPPGPGPRPPHPVPIQPPRPEPIRPPQNDWIRNLIEVLLYNEMYKRRCRYNRCRKWW